MIRKFNHITDYLMTEEMARERLCADQVDVTWYTNKTNTESVLHSHPYYEAILPISGEVLYSVNGSLYHLHTGELIIFPTRSSIPASSISARTSPSACS